MRYSKTITSRSVPWLILLIWLSFWLRLHHIEAFSFWTDEGLTPLRSSYPILEILSNHITIQQAVTNDTHPPLFYLIIHFSRQIFGETDFAYRFPSVLAGVLLVPLLYQFGRRLHGRALGLLAALLTAVNPLQIWYANEARMYTLLALLTAGATYVLWRALQVEEIGDWRLEIKRPLNLQSLISNLTLYHYFALYVLLAGLAFYTHYTTVFLILGQGLFWVWLLWRRGYKKLIAATAVLAVLVAVPVIPFTVPRLFTGAEANYFYVRPLVMLQDVVRFFHLGRSVDFEQPLTRLINLAAFAFLLLGFYGAKSNLKRAFLFVYLLAVVLGLMAGSLLKPMYQGVRHIMIGSPAFILLVSWGMVFAGERGSVISKQWAVNSFKRRVKGAGWVLVTAVGLIFIVGGSLLSVYNLYFEERFGKDEFREMIQFIESRAGANDVIVYNNAILLPLHEHYRTRPDVAVTASPIYPTLAANTAVPQLEALAAKYDRIWLVTDPPADGRDDNKIVQTWLDQHTTPISDYLFQAQTVEVRSILYETTPLAATAVPETAQPLPIEWPGLPALAGIDFEYPQPAALPTLWFSLYWQGELSDLDTAVRFQLQDGDGRSWWAESEQRLLPEEGVWPDAPFVRQSVQLPLPPGTPPGTYTLLAQPLNQPDGSAIGAVEPLADLTIAASSAWPAPPQMNGLPALIFANGVTLQSVAIPAEEVRPGHNLPLTLLWQTGPDPASLLSYELEVIGPDGRQLRTQTDPVGARWLTTYPPHTLLRERTGLYFPPETEPGRYRLRWQLQEEGEVVPGRPFWQPFSQEHIYYGTVTVLPWPLETKLPLGLQRLDARFGSAISLAGYETMLEDGQLKTTLTWQAHDQPDENLFVFLHFVDENGEIVAQVDSVPVSGLRPTKGWRPGEVLTDEHTLPLPPGLPAGEYTLWLGLFNPDTNIRLPIVVDGEEQADGRLLLNSFDITN